ncbi:hypothetical protein [Arthrobacter sp. PsM3]|uniref:hypothetical protein n=1 Tax=Arthrobacter sp. PsM3 TaxID=3030531 RepID=UPI00263AC301|nr:hypothetical protein [Arthrobacter sp. PsM3]MDN4645803.1 hypothetical protein [Arthrobacter sp. PsM3]
MGDPTTIALNLTFFGTLGVALVMFFGLFLVFVATLVIAGLGRLVAVTVMAVGRGLFRTGSRAERIAPPVQQDRPLRTIGDAQQPQSGKTAKPAKSAKPGKPARPAKPAKKEPVLAPGWSAAVARADARAIARAKAAAAPEVKVSVRELPSPTAPAQDIAAVAPLVESATDRNGQLGTVPPAFKKSPMPAAKSLLDTGSMVSLPGRLPLPRKPLGRPLNEQLPRPQGKQLPKPQAQERKAG